MQTFLHMIEVIYLYKNKFFVAIKNILDQSSNVHDFGLYCVLNYKIYNQYHFTVLLPDASGFMNLLSKIIPIIIL